MFFSFNSENIQFFIIKTVCSYFKAQKIIALFPLKKKKRKSKDKS